jgi:tetrahydrodipicolinate N-succinyltransferase
LGSQEEGVKMKKVLIEIYLDKDGKIKVEKNWKNLNELNYLKWSELEATLWELYQWCQKEIWSKEG